uniref:PA domain-containing protein n=1 Tax=Steinernema glaseri TaxID=37863 RepID=A0A1I8A4L4_9BILA
MVYIPKIPISSLALVTVLLVLFTICAEADFFFTIQYPTKLEYLYHITPSYDIGAPFPPYPTKDAIMVLADPSHACTPLKNVVDVYGSVVLIERGKCSFVDKAINAERAGAAFVIVSDTVNGTDELIEMVSDQTRRRAGIPAAYLNGASGKKIRNYLMQSEFVIELTIPLNYTYPFVPDDVPSRPPWELWH